MGAGRGPLGSPCRTVPKAGRGRGWLCRRTGTNAGAVAVRVFPSYYTTTLGSDYLNQKLTDLASSEWRASLPFGHSGCLGPDEKTTVLPPRFSSRLQPLRLSGKPSGIARTYS
jgi:hypothetical protein